MSAKAFISLKGKEEGKGNMKKETLNEKEKLFCRYISEHRTPREAAALAGYKNPKKTGRQLISKQRISEYAKGLPVLPPGMQEVADGLRRIAFGGIADVIRLLTAEEIKDLDPESLDLVMISELKFQRGGGIEVKLQDRVKALEKLQQIAASTSEESQSSFFGALAKTAELLEEDKME